ncbi:MAG TPA: hypothetical protein VLH56_08585 [Dissulfurispiraceae bacterium]|nr:hypothetical protein [Dissulfurispiraceae bacterium]
MIQKPPRRIQVTKWSYESETVQTVGKGKVSLLEWLNMERARLAAQGSASVINTYRGVGDEESQYALFREEEREHKPKWRR